MSENSNPNHIENDEFNPNHENGEYEDLITRLKEIKLTIALFDKTIFK